MNAINQKNLQRVINCIHKLDFLRLDKQTLLFLSGDPTYLSPYDIELSPTYFRPCSVEFLIYPSTPFKAFWNPDCVTSTSLAFDSFLEIRLSDVLTYNMHFKCTQSIWIINTYKNKSQKNYQNFVSICHHILTQSFRPCFGLISGG